MLGRLIVISLVSVLAGFSSSYATGNNYGVLESQCTVTDFNNGVLYFRCTGHRLATALSQFKERNPTLRIVAMYGDERSSYGISEGFYVVTEHR